MFLENSWFRCFERKFSGEYPVTLVRGSPKITNFQNLLEFARDETKILIPTADAELLHITTIDDVRYTINFRLKDL